MSERDFRTPLERAVDGMSEIEHLEVLRYLMGKTEKPVAALQRGIYAANYEIKLVDNAISLMGLCMFGEKRKNKRELKAHKNCLKEYVMVLESILYMRSNIDWIEKIKVTEKYAAFSKTKLYDLYADSVRQYTDASRDQEHLRICVDSNTNIPDRTAAILGKGKDPRPEMIKSAVRLQGMGADVIIVPCNTAHCFLPDVEKCLDIPVLYMPSETAKAVHAQNVQIAAVLATDGTLQSGLYDCELRKLGITPVHPDAEDQKMIMELIYDYVKASKEYPTPENILAMEQRLIRQGVQCLILGCTELPIAFSQIKTTLPIIDPTTVLAQSAICYTNSKLKK